jgi:hypothetical protein
MFDGLWQIQPRDVLQQLGQRHSMATATKPFAFLGWPVRRSTLELRDWDVQRPDQLGAAIVAIDKDRLPRLKPTNLFGDITFDI